MPNAKLSDRAHGRAKDADRTITDEVDRWLGCAETLDRLFILEDGADTLHRPDVTPHNVLEAECQVPTNDPFIAVGPRTAERLLESGGERCDICFDDG